MITNLTPISSDSSFIRKILEKLFVSLFYGMVCYALFWFFNKPEIEWSQNPFNYWITAFAVVMLGSLFSDEDKQNPSSISQMLFGIAIIIFILGIIIMLFVATKDFMYPVEHFGGDGFSGSRGIIN